MRMERIARRASHSQAKTNPRGSDSDISPINSPKVDRFRKHNISTISDGRFQNLDNDKNNDKETAKSNRNPQDVTDNHTIKSTEFYGMCGLSRMKSSPKTFYCASAVLGPAINGTALENDNNGMSILGSSCGKLCLYHGQHMLCSISAHKQSLGGCTSVFSCSHGILSGGGDGRLFVWKLKHTEADGYKLIIHKMIEVAQFGCLTPCVQSLCWHDNGDTIILGVLSCEVYEISLLQNIDINNGPIIHCHSARNEVGEMWALAVHPTLPRAATAGDDGIVRVWDIKTHKQIAAVRMRCMCRSASYSSKGTWLCIGLGGPEEIRPKTSRKDGAFCVVNPNNLKVICERRFSHAWISAVTFSANDEFLVVGTGSGEIFLHRCVIHGIGSATGIKLDFPLIHKFKVRDSGAVRRLDFDKRSRWLQVECRLTFARKRWVERFDIKKLLPGEAKDKKNVTWHTWTMTVGDMLEGIYYGQVPLEVCAKSRSGKLVAIGSGAGEVMLARFPCKNSGPLVKHFCGSVSHISNLKWSYEDKYLMVSGGDDKCVFQYTTQIDDADPNAEGRRQRLELLHEDQKKLNLESKKVFRQTRDMLAPFIKKKNALISRQEILVKEIKSLKEQASKFKAIGKEPLYITNMLFNARKELKELNPPLSSIRRRLAEHTVKLKGKDSLYVELQTKQAKLKRDIEEISGYSADAIIGGVLIDKTDSLDNTEEATAGALRVAYWANTKENLLDTEDFIGDRTTAAPKSTLELSWVYGFDGRGVQNNLMYVGTNQILYTIARAIVIYDVVTHTQRRFGEHHFDILSIASHPNKELIASGERGDIPMIKIWRIDDLSVVQTIVGYHRKGISHLCFSKQEGRYLLTVGEDFCHCIAMYDWKVGEVLCHVKGGVETIYAAIFMPDTCGFIQCGYKHIKVHKFHGRHVETKRVLFHGKGDLQRFLCVCFSGSYPIIGTEDGHLYQLRSDSRNLWKVVKAHIGAVNCIRGYTNCVISGGNDGLVKIWSTTLVLQITLDLNALDQNVDDTCDIADAYSGDEATSSDDVNACTDDEPLLADDSKFKGQLLGNNWKKVLNERARRKQEAKTSTQQREKERRERSERQVDLYEKRNKKQIRELERQKRKEIKLSEKLKRKEARAQRRALKATKKALKQSNLDDNADDEATDISSDPEDTDDITSDSDSDLSNLSSSSDENADGGEKKMTISNTVKDPEGPEKWQLCLPSSFRKIRASKLREMDFKDSGGNFEGAIECDLSGEKLANEYFDFETKLKEMGNTGNDSESEKEEDAEFWYTRINNDGKGRAFILSSHAYNLAFPTKATDLKKQNFFRTSLTRIVQSIPGKVTAKYKEISIDEDAEFLCPHSNEDLKEEFFYHAWLRDDTPIDISITAFGEEYSDGDLLKLAEFNIAETNFEKDKDSDTRSLSRTSSPTNLDNSKPNENVDLASKNSSEDPKFGVDFPELPDFIDKNDVNEINFETEHEDKNELSSSGNYELYTLKNHPDANTREWHSILREGGDVRAMIAEKARMDAIADAIRLASEADQNIFAGVDDDMVSSGEGKLYNFKTEFRAEGDYRTMQLLNLENTNKDKNENDFERLLGNHKANDNSDISYDSSSNDSMASSGVENPFCIRDGVHLNGDSDEENVYGTVMSDSSAYDSNWSGPGAISDSSGLLDLFELKDGLSPFAEGRLARTQRQIRNGILDEAYIPGVLNHPKHMRRFDPRRVEIFDQEVVLAKCIKDYDWMVEGDIDEVLVGTMVLVLDNNFDARPGPCSPDDKWMVRDIHNSKNVGTAFGHCFEVISKRPLGKSRMGCLQKFYAEYAPSRKGLLTVENTLLRYQNKEQKLFNLLHKKYGSAPEELILPMFEAPKSEDLSIGMLVEVNVRGKGKWFKGFIRRRRGRQRFDVELKDGDPDLILYASDLYSAGEDDGSLSDETLNQSEDSDEWTSVGTIDDDEVKVIEQKEVKVPKFLQLAKQTQNRTPTKPILVKTKVSKRTKDNLFRHKIASLCWDGGEKVVVGTLSGQVREVWVNDDKKTIDVNKNPVVHGQWQWDWVRRITTDSYDMHKPIAMCFRNRHNEFFTVDGALLSVYTFEHHLAPLKRNKRRKAVYMRQNGKLRLSESCRSTPDGKLVAVGHTGIFGIGFSTCTLYDTDTLKPMYFFRDTERSNLSTTTCIQFSKDGKFIATGMSNGYVHIRQVEEFYENKTKRFVLKCSINMSENHERIEQMDWSTSNANLRATDKLGNLRYANLKNLETADFIWQKDTLAIVAQSTSWVTFTCRDSFCNIKRHSTNRLTFDGNHIPTTGCKTMKHNKRQYIAAGAPGGSLLFMSYPWIRGRANYKYHLHTSGIRQMEFSFDGKSLAVCGGIDRAISLWSKEYVEQMFEWGISLDFTQYLLEKDAWYMSPEENSFVSKSMLVEDGKLRKAGIPLNMSLVWCYSPVCSDVFYTQNHEVVFYSESVAVVYNKKRHQQKFFEKHMADISCIARSNKGDVVATGDVYHTPMIRVWNSMTMQESCALKLDTKEGVDCIAFSKDDLSLAVIGKDAEHTLSIFRCNGPHWGFGGNLLASHGIGPAPCISVSFTPWYDLPIMTVSLDTVKFWQLRGRNLRWIFSIDEDEENLKKQQEVDIEIGDGVPTNIRWLGMNDNNDLEVVDGVQKMYRSDGNERAVTPITILRTATEDNNTKTQDGETDDTSPEYIAAQMRDTCTLLFGKVNSETKNDESKNKAHRINSEKKKNEYDFIPLQGAQLLPMTNNDSKSSEDDNKKGAKKSRRKSLSGAIVHGIDSEILNPFASIQGKHRSSIEKLAKSKKQNWIAPPGLGVCLISNLRYMENEIDGLISLKGLSSNVAGGVGSFEIGFGESLSSDKEYKLQNDKDSSASSSSDEMEYVNEENKDLVLQQRNVLDTLRNKNKPVRLIQRTDKPGKRKLKIHTGLSIDTDLNEGLISPPGTLSPSRPSTNSSLVSLRQMSSVLESDRFSRDGKKNSRFSFQPDSRRSSAKSGKRNSGVQMSSPQSSEGSRRQSVQSSNKRNNRRMSKDLTNIGGNTLKQNLKNITTTAGQINENTSSNRRMSKTGKMRRLSKISGGRRLSQSIKMKNVKRNTRRLSKELTTMANERRMSKKESTRYIRRLSESESKRVNSLNKNGMRRLSRVCDLGSYQGRSSRQSHRLSFVRKDSRASKALKRMSSISNSYGDDNVVEQASHTADILDEDDTAVAAQILCITQFGEFMIGGDVDGFLVIFEYEIITERVNAHNDEILCLHSTSMGLASGSTDGIVKLWNHRLIMTHQYNMYQMPSSCIRSIFWNTEADSILAAMEDGKVVEVTIHSGTVTEIMDAHHDDVIIDLATHPVNPLLVSIGADRRMNIIHTQNQGIIRKTQFDTDPTAVCWFPKSNFIAVGFKEEFSSQKATNPCWAICSGVNLSICFVGVQTKETITSLCISPDEKTLVAMTKKNKIVLYSTSPQNNSLVSNITCNLIRCIDVTTVLPIHHMGFRPDGRILQFFRAHESGKARIQSVIDLDETDEALKEFDADSGAASEDWRGVWISIEAANDALLVFTRPSHQNPSYTKLVDASHGTDKELNFRGFNIDRYKCKAKLGFPHASVAKYDSSGNVLFITNMNRPSLMQYRLKVVDLRTQNKKSAGPKRVEMRTSIVYGAERDGVKW